MRTIFFIGLLLLPSSASAQVVITEVMWAGSELSTADEWLEIYNHSEEDVSLFGWSITTRKSDGSDVPIITFEEDAVIKAGEYQIISNYNTDRSALTISPHYITTSVSLPNTKLLLFLNNTSETIDQVDDGVGVPFAGSRDPFASMERIDFLASGSKKSNWKTAENFGTPGNPNRSRIQSSASSASSASSVLSAHSIRITEVLVDPIGSNDYSWIELGNFSDAPINIAGWNLSDGSRSYAVEPRSDDGYVLAPGEHTIFFHYQSHLSLTDSDIITIRHQDHEVDRLPLSEAGEEISLGRTDDGSRGLYCVPTPREKNTERVLDPHIEIQSGRATDYTKVTLNFQATVDAGSLKTAECSWDFDDCTASQKCNPPSHSWDYPGVYEVMLRVQTKCGEEIERTKEVVVLEKKNPKRSSSRMKSYYSSSKISHTESNISRSFSSLRSSIMLSSSKNEQKMYSTKSSSWSSENRVLNLPVRYVNVVQKHVESSRQLSSSSMQDIWQQKAKIPISEPANSPSDSGFAWVMLFSQSALWLLLAGKKMI